MAQDGCCVGFVLSEGSIETVERTAMCSANRVERAMAAMPDASQDETAAAPSSCSPTVFIAIAGETDAQSIALSSACDSDPPSLEPQSKITAACRLAHS